MSQFCGSPAESSKRCGVTCAPIGSTTKVKTRARTGAQYRTMIVTSAQESLVRLLHIQYQGVNSVKQISGFFHGTSHSCVKLTFQLNPIAYFVQRVVYYVEFFTR